MSQEQVRQIVGSKEFPGLRSLSPETTGGFFLSASGEAVLTVVFNRQQDKLTYVDVSSDFLFVVAMREDAASLGYTDWESSLIFEDWSMSNLQLGTSKGEVLRAFGQFEQNGFANVDTVYVQYRPVDLHNAEDACIRSSSGTSLLFSQETKRESQRLRIGLFGEKAESISLSAER